MATKEEDPHLDQLDQHVRVCIGIFVALIGLTFITVVVSYLHLPTAAAITIALCIAAVKGSLVISYFMHLLSEKTLIYWALGITVVFFIFLMVLPIITVKDPITQTIMLKY